MNNINTYIQEKLVINKNIKDPISETLCKFFNSSEQETNFLKKYWNSTPDETAHLLGCTINDLDNLIMTPLEAFVMIAYMLIDDEFGPAMYNKLGLTSYKERGGKNNPLDYSWFEEDGWNNKEIVLDNLQDWIKDNYEEFKKIYDFTKKHYDYINKKGGTDYIFYMHKYI